MEYVLDGSFALAWVLPDETSPDADRFVDRLTLHDVLWVPTLWRYEVSNGLAMAQRRRRLAEVDRFRAIALLAKLPIRTEAQVGAVAIRRLSALALATGLSAYDAAYLDLAVQKGIGLASQLSKLEPTSPITLTSPPM
jgi:predicted nucleic acid-binding protein